VPPPRDEVAEATDCTEAKTDEHEALDFVFLSIASVVVSTHVAV
jgi:hypothetical protein